TAGTARCGSFPASPPRNYISAATLERALNHISLGLLEREVIESLGGFAHPEPQVRDFDRVVFCQKHRALHDVRKLADVARPLVRLESPAGPLAEQERLAAVLLGMARQVVRSQQWDIVASRAQRRQRDFDCVQAKVK